MSFAIYAIHVQTHGLDMVMAEFLESTPAVELTPDEVEEIPARLREKIEAGSSLRGKRQRLRRWILIGTQSEQEAAFMCATATMAGRILDQRRMELTERNIEALVDLYLQGEKQADVDRELEQDNAELRAEYLREVPTFTTADIHTLMHGSQLKQPKRTCLPMETREEGLCGAQRPRSAVSVLSVRRRPSAACR